MKKGVSIFIITLFSSFSFVSALSYTYDSNGNRISGDGFYREYDSSNHLVNVYTGSEPLIANLVENYTWSLSEERVVAKYVYYNRTLNESVYYPYENWVRVVNSSGSFDFYYVIQNSEVVAMQDYAGHKFYYHNDHKGSVQLVTNENGSAIERTFYEPFGVVTFGGSKTRFDYEGEEFDSVTGDYDFDARRFDSSNNQFIQPDSVIQNVYDPQSLNHYSFERNNPYKYEDETGKSAAPYHLLGTYLALRELGYSLSDSISLAIDSILPDLNQENPNFYKDGESYIDYHLDPEVNNAEKEFILEENAQKFNEAYKNGDTDAGRYLHVFGDTIHQGAPPAGPESSIGEWSIHQIIDFNPRNIERTKENIVKTLKNNVLQDSKNKATNNGVDLMKNSCSIVQTILGGKK